MKSWLSFTSASLTPIAAGTFPTICNCLMFSFLNSIWWTYPFSISVNGTAEIWVSSGLLLSSRWNVSSVASHSCYCFANTSSIKQACHHVAFIAATGFVHRIAVIWVVVTRCMFSNTSIIYVIVVCNSNSTFNQELSIQSNTVLSYRGPFVGWCRKYENQSVCVFQSKMWLP